MIRLFKFYDKDEIYKTDREKTIFFIMDFGNGIEEWLRWCDEWGDYFVAKDAPRNDSHYALLSKASPEPVEGLIRFAPAPKRPRAAQ